MHLKWEYHYILPNHAVSPDDGADKDMAKMPYPCSFTDFAGLIDPRAFVNKYAVRRVAHVFSLCVVGASICLGWPVALSFMPS